MKKLILLLILVFPAVSHAQLIKWQEPSNKVDTINLPFKGPFVLKKNVLNPSKEAGNMMVKATNFKLGALGCAAVSSGIWFVTKDEDNKKATRIVSIVSGIASVSCYLVALRYDWMAGKYLQMSVSPGGVTASVKF
jgi:hypothetical protein